MTNDRENLTTDRAVSATYRELADERAPASLDEKVLRRAAARPRARFGIGGAWMKPVAWAATIGLSLAIVLELTQVPQAPLDVDLLGVEVLDDQLLDDQSPDVEVLDEKPVARPMGEHPAPASVEPATAKENGSMKPARLRSDSGAVDEPWAPAMAPTAAPTAAPAAAMPPAATPTPAPAPETAQPQMQESADLQPPADSDVAPDVRSDEVAGTAAFAVRAKRMLLPEQPGLCPETVRDVAEDWYRCIEAQRDEVPQAWVNRELEEFRTRFPDFKASDAE